MRYVLLALIIVGCGSPNTIPQNSEPLNRDKQKLRIELALLSYFKTDIHSVFKETSVYLTDEKSLSDWCEKEAVGCYNQKTILLSSSEESFQSCTTLAHEYIHAIGDQIYGDMDKNHEKYPFELLSSMACYFPV